MEDFEKGPKKPKVVNIKKAKRNIERKEKVSKIKSEHEALTAFNLGKTLYSKGQLQKAKEYFSNAVETDPSYVLAWYNLAITCEDLGEMGEAVRCYQEAIKHNPGYSDAHYNLAKLLESGNPLRAIHHYNQFLKFSDVRDRDREIAGIRMAWLKRRITIK